VQKIISRRAALIHLAAGGAGLVAGRSRAIAKASQPATPVNFAVPAGACDCHTHIFGDPAKYQFWSGRVYTPEPASEAEMRTLHRALHMDGVVIVQPSVYGTDNTCTIDAVRQFGGRARGVAVVGDQTTDAQLDAMHRDGFRGIRLNLETAGQTDPAGARRRFQNAVERMRARHWHIQMFTRLSVIEGIHDQVMAAPIPVVFDHFGGAQAALGIAQPGFNALIDLVRNGKAYVKISGAYRASSQPPDYADVKPLAQALIAANPERILWGTDWPHPNSTPPASQPVTVVTPLLQIDDGRLLNLLPAWAPDAAVRKTILVDNPARLYGF
jgi:predicted TIM-barrel fold metal-dependent hydrolase